MNPAKPAFVLLFSAASLAQTPAPGNPPVPPRPPTSRAGQFDIASLDRSVDPCVDFYQFACGNWMKSNAIPPDQARWGRFNELAERNRELVHQILERASAPDPKRNPLEQKYGDYYASCMDEAAIEAKGISPIKPELDRIGRISQSSQLIDEIAHLHEISHGGGRGGGGGPTRALFMFVATPDLHDATQVIASVDQGGLGLPDRDYYLKDDPKSVETRTQYVAHMQKMFRLLGDAPQTAVEETKAVLRIETELAKASMDRVMRRDPHNRDHKMKVKDLAALAPNFQFSRFFKDSGSPEFQELNVGNPEFFKRVNAAIRTVPLKDWKSYLRWHLVDSKAPALTRSFVEENFDFHGRILTGQKELGARWKRCVQMTDRDLGEAVGQPYVDATFGVEGKQRTQKMVQAIERAMEKDIKELSWMTAETKQRALEKLHAITNKIGYPDKWRDYSTVKIDRGDFVGNIQHAAEFEHRRQLSRIGQPLDKTEWGMTPPTVNAYYSPPENDINFPAGILQPPFYDNRIDDAVNYGAIGTVIGHELTHGFDDQGRKFDPQGNLRDWWTEKDAKEFERRASCIADEYSGFVAVKDPELKLNGRLTLGENTADNGGLRVAHMAFLDSVAGKPPQPVDGFTSEQRVFLGFAQIWCENSTEESARLRALTDPHSPGRYRTNGVVQNMPEFQKAFACKAGQPMVRSEPCRVW
jgi:putative endopeptidase